jgi:glycoside/pentoside/hexuronide:cation symporter, GPH family
VNAAPVAVTSTLFLVFVESRLAAPDYSGPLLLLFFAAAAASSWLWARLAQRYGVKSALMIGMTVSVASFLWTATLGPGELLAFSIICVASGAALAADMTLLPALFARRLGQLGLGGEAAAFSLWSFVSKLSLAFAAGLLSVLGAYGFQTGADNPPAALTALTVLYAVLPCGLKLMAIGLLTVIPIAKE